MMKAVVAKQWEYTLKTGTRLRTALRDAMDDPEDTWKLTDVIRALNVAYEELFDAGLIDDWDYEHYTEDFEMYMDDELEGWDDPEDIVDYELSNFYDLCDNINVWIPLD